MIPIVALSLSLNPTSSSEVADSTTEKHRTDFVIAPKFNKPGTFQDGLAPVKKNDRWGYINTEGEWQLNPQFSGARSFNNGLAAVRTPDGWGYITSEGNWHISPQFEKAESFREGLAGVRKNSKWSFINTRGETITSLQYDWVGQFQNGLAVVSQGARKTYIDTNGQKRFDHDFLDAGKFTGKSAPVKTENGWGYINRNGTLTINAQYDWASSTVKGLKRIKEDGQWRLLRNPGNESVGIDAQFVSQPGENGLIRIDQKGRIGFLNSEFEVVIPPRYEQALSFKGDYTPAKKDGLWGYINTKGEWIIEPKYNAAGPFSDGLAPVKVNNRWGYIPKPGGTYDDDRLIRKSYRLDTGIDQIKPASLETSLSEEFPTWRYSKRDRYVKILSTAHDDWQREVNAPVSNFDMPNAKYEVTRHPYQEPTYLQIEGAEQFFWRSLKSAMNRNWFIVDVGLKDGYGLDGKGGVDNHFFKAENFRDENLLVPNRPESLIYHDSNSRGVSLNGMMYYHTSRNEGAPQIGGPLTPWHYHVFDKPVCHRGVLVQPFDSECSGGDKLIRSPEMIHTWFIDHPAGSFGTQTKLAKKRLHDRSFIYNPN